MVAFFVSDAESIENRSIIGVYYLSLRLCSLNFRVAGVACMEQISQVEEGAMRAS